jgi:hypothetical protein
VDDELDPFAVGDTDFQQTAGAIGADVHRDVVVRKVDPPDRVPVGMEDVFVSDAMVASTV